MAVHHVIRWLPDGSSEWLSLSREGAVLQGPQAGLPAAAAEHTTLILPAEEVLGLRAPRVARNVVQLARALPFAIEEQLAAPVEQQHVAFDAAGNGEGVAVAVVARERIEARLAALSAAGIAADAAFAEWQLVEDGAGWQEHDRLVLRDAERALCLPLADLPALADWLARNGLAPAERRVARVDGPVLEDVADQPVDAALPELARRLRRAPALNLLQGPYTPRRRSETVQRGWRIAAILAGIAVLLGLALPAVEQRALQQHTAQRQQEMERLLRQALPDVQRVVDPVAQLRGALQGRGAQSDALGLLGRVAPLLAGGTRLTLDAVEYRSGALELVVIAEDVASLDSLRERLAQQGMQVELTGANPGSSGVEGRLRVRGGGA